MSSPRSRGSAVASKADTWMPLYIADYLRKTMHLTRDQHGAYLLLLMACWDRGGRLPNDPGQLASIARATAAEWRKLAPVILPFFEADGDSITQGRVLEEREKAQRLSEARRQAGLQGGRPRKHPESTDESKPESGPKPNALATGMQTETPERVALPSPSTPPSEEGNADAFLVAPVSDEPTEPSTRKRSYPPDFEEAWKAYPHHPGRSSKPNALAEWRKLPVEERAGLLGCIERFRPNVEAVCGGKGAPCMGRWLKDGKHLNWAAPAAVLFPEEAGEAPPDPWRFRMIQFTRNAYWNSLDWGPKPGREGCQVPAAVLREFDLEPKPEPVGRVA
jgi:uncharacterized protein YdaU (DUF1376 family)